MFICGTVVVKIRKRILNTELDLKCQLCSVSSVLGWGENERSVNVFLCGTTLCILNVNIMQKQYSTSL